jgi:myo-inositol-1(or 4)-monophosphatase
MDAPVMTNTQLRMALAEMVRASQAAGIILRRHLDKPKRAQSVSRHDIKLELDVRCQELIQRRLRRAFPEIAVLGEEGTDGDPNAPFRWVIDPIDGTVNFTYGIPHASVSIALEARPNQSPAQQSGPSRRGTGSMPPRTLAGVIYDPFADELWTAIRGGPARCNGRVVRVSNRRRLAEIIATIGFAKHRRSLERMLPVFQRLAHRVRKVRILGSAALGLAYVAAGRLDLYLESGIRWWDIAAGGLILECAGGDFWHEHVPGQPPHTYRLMASNGRFRSQIRRLLDSDSERTPRRIKP